MAPHSSLIGAYPLENNIDDVLLTVVFGLVGYVARKLDYPLAPFTLALLLGPMLERDMRPSLIMAGGYSPIIFLTHPICTFFLVLAFLLVAFSAFRRAPTKEEANSQAEFHRFGFCPSPNLPPIIPDEKPDEDNNFIFQDFCKRLILLHKTI